MYVVDASVWVSRFVSADAHHEPSYQWLFRAIDRATLLVAPALLLVEVAGAVSRRTGQADLAARAVELLEQLPRSRWVAVDAQLARLAAGIAGDLGMRGADAMYVALAQRFAFSLVTWDREQLERSRAAIRVYTPQEAPDL